MKTIYFKTTFLALICMFFTVSVSRASAAAQPHFPDPHSLQPFPTAYGAHANISGNVNAKTGPAPDASVPALPSTASQPALPSMPEEGSGDLEIGAALGCVVLAGGFFLARKHKN